MALFDVHTESASFVEAWSEFDSLHAWVNPPALPIPSENDGQFTYRTHNQTIAETELDNTEVRLIDCPIGEQDETQINYRQQIYFVLKFHEMHGKEVLQRWIRPLQDLLILTTGRPARVTSLLLRPADAEPSQTLAEAHFAAVQPSPTQPPNWAGLEVNTSATLLTFSNSPLSFDVLMRNWFRIRSQFAEVVTLLHSPSYVDSMFNEHRFASLFQSAEALADAVGLSGREKSRAEHRQRVARITAAAQSAGVDSETIEWAKRVLESRNDKPLWKQIHDLVHSTGRIGRRVLVASPDFAKIVTSARTGVSHGGAPRKLDSTDRHWYGDVLRWLVRARLLFELGVSLQEIERRIDRRASFQFSLDRLTDSTKDNS
jgi:hypothetical protein